VEVDPFAEKLAAVRKRFAAKLTGRIAEIDAALPELTGISSDTAGKVYDAHRKVHDLCGLGPTLGFDATGKAARICERILLQPSRGERGLTEQELAQLRGARRSARRCFERLSAHRHCTGVNEMARKAPVILFASVVAITAANAQAQTRSRQGEPAKPASQNVAARKAAEADDLSRPRPGAITSTISLADIGYATGFRFANLGGRRDLFVSLPAGADVTARELVLTVDDVSAHEARRSLEVLLNNRSVAAIALDGKAQGRTIRIPLGNARPKDGFLKFSFIYSGAATPDRCIDTRYVGDSLTVRAESAVDIDIAFTGSPDIATTVALLPHDVAIVLPRRPLLPADIATALTVARALAGSGRRVSFHHGFEGLPEIAKRDERPWTRGLVAIGLVQEVMGYLDSPIATMAGPAPTFGALTAVRIGGMPALIVSDASAARAGRMLASPSLNAVRGVSSASIGDIATQAAHGPGDVRTSRPGAAASRRVRPRRPSGHARHPRTAASDQAVAVAA
jgi:hypothetical protein